MSPDSTLFKRWSGDPSRWEAVSFERGASSGPLPVWARPEYPATHIRIQDILEMEGLGLGPPHFFMG